MNKAMTTSLLPSQKISLLFTSPLLPTYFTSFCAHSIVRAWESLKQEDKTMSQKQEGKNGSQEKALETEAQK
jgi:hypothetical protein